MAEEPNLSTGVAPETLRRDGLIAYVLYAGVVFFFVPAVAGVTFAHLKQRQLRRTYLESHIVWLIRTFWTALVLGVLGVLLSYLIVGIPIVILIVVWYFYRLIKGFLAFNRGQPLSDPTAFL